MIDQCDQTCFIINITLIAYGFEGPEIVILVDCIEPSLLGLSSVVAQNVFKFAVVLGSCPLKG